jgi:transposase InsO family protein
MLAWLDLAKSKFYNWRGRYGKENAHNGKIPRDFWLTPNEQDRIIQFYRENPLEGYRRLTFMMIDADVIAVSPSTTYNVLKKAGFLDKNRNKPSLKGTGFVQPLKPHEHWHVDISYINISGTFYYLCSVLDGYSRHIVHWEIRESMREAEIETIIQRGVEKFPGVNPRIISDNGPQFIAKDFKNFIRLSGMDHVRTSPYYPQSNGKIERWHRELKSQCIRPKQASSKDEAITNVTEFVVHYNNKRLHSAIGYVTPLDKLQGREGEIHKVRDERLTKARMERRQRCRVMGDLSPNQGIPLTGEQAAKEIVVNGAEGSVSVPLTTSDRQLNSCLRNALINEIRNHGSPKFRET